LSILISIIGILLTIFFVIGTHEAAHFAVARCLGVKVLRFSIGFGKTLLRWHDKKGTEYVLALIPLGGYVKMLDETEGEVPINELGQAYNRQPFYKKFLIVLAGPISNIVCAFILYWLIFMIGFITIKPIIGTVLPKSIAAEAGLKPQQTITHVDNKEINSWTSVFFRLMIHLGNQDHVKINTTTFADHKNNEYVLDLSNWHMDELHPDPLTSLGMTPYQPTGKWPKEMLHKIQYGPLSAAAHAGEEIYDLTYFNFILFEKMFTGKLSLKSLGGPITIFESAGEAFNAGYLAFMGFLAFLSVSIGVINLLPIPGLDGGHLFIQAIEAIIRRPIPERYLLILFKLGFIFILFVLFQALVNDILRMY